MELLNKHLYNTMSKKFRKSTHERSNLFAVFSIHENPRIFNPEMANNRRKMTRVNRTSTRWQCDDLDERLLKFNQCQYGT